MTAENIITELKALPRLVITIGGDIGAGKSTFAKRLAKELDIPRIYIGQFMREEAKKRNITLDELSKLQEQDESIDRYFDKLQKEKSENINKAIFEGRTSWHFVKNPTITIYLAVDPDVATERIWDDRNDKRDQYGNKEALHLANQERKQSEINRYKKYYGIDTYDVNNYDIVVITSDLTLDEVFNQTINQIQTFISTT